MTGLPRFEEVARVRPLDLLTPEATMLPPGEPVPLPQPAPYVAVVADVAGPAALGLGHGLSGHLDERGRTRLQVGATVLRSRRHGRARGRVDALALTLTGRQLTLFTRAGGSWTARAKADLGQGRSDAAPVNDPHWLAAIAAWARGAVTGCRAGGFGQLGLRDLRVVSHADGTAYLPEGERPGTVLLTATSAGPGFFGTGHASVWALDTATLTLAHRGDLFFRRGGRVYGDQAVHLVRLPAGPTAGPEWLVATSTWGDFLDPATDHVHVEVGRTDADLLHGRHVVATEPLHLPTDGLGSVGVWDPHLVRVPAEATGAVDERDGADGSAWLVGYVSARRYFDFHPVLATGPSLDRLRLRAAATGRRATEGTTITRVADGPTGVQWRVLASDGRLRRRLIGRPGRSRDRGVPQAAYPVFDLDLRQVGTLDAPYPTNIPWPTIVPGSASHDGRALLVGFDATPAGGRLTGYGTHGAVVFAREAGDSE